MSDWLIRIHNDVAYIWKRKFFCGVFAIPWKFHGGTDIIRTPDDNNDVLAAAIAYIKHIDATADITVKL